MGAVFGTTWTDLRRGRATTRSGVSLPDEATTRTTADERAISTPPSHEGGETGERSEASGRRASHAGCRLVQTARFAGSSTAATAGDSDESRCGVRAGHNGPASDCT